MTEVKWFWRENQRNKHSNEFRNWENAIQQTLVHYHSSAPAPPPHSLLWFQISCHQVCTLFSWRTCSGNGAYWLYAYIYSCRIIFIGILICLHVWMQTHTHQCDYGDNIRVDRLFKHTFWTWLRQWYVVQVCRKTFSWFKAKRFKNDSEAFANCFHSYQLPHILFRRHQYSSS